MNEQSSAVVKAAWITAIVSCIGVTLAAVIGLGLPYVQKLAVLDESKTVVIVVTVPASQPIAQPTQVEPKAAVVVVTATAPQPTVSARPMQPGRTSAPPPCTNGDWELCWTYDEATRTMTWIGPSDVLIGQRDSSLKKIHDGYTAIFATSVTMKMDICVGEVDGQQVTTCGPFPTMTIPPGMHRVVSTPNPQGGFKAYP